MLNTTFYAYPAVGDSIFIQNYIYNNPNTLATFQADIEETADFMELFADKFGALTPSLTKKYGHSMAPIGGGMEHQTMTTQGSFNRTLTAHELGHQWFGNNVTCASWADIWVNEGFASYSEYVMLENLYPAFDSRAWMSQTHGSVINQPGGSTWVEDSLNVGRIFNNRLSYDKGAAIIHTMRFLMNDDDLFFQTLQNFQADFADSTAIGLDIRDALADASGIDYTDMFDQWYFGEGYPTYKVVYGTANDLVKVRISHLPSSSTPTFTNPLELRFTRNGGMGDTIIRFDITSNNDEFIIPSLPNVNNIVSIDPNNWVVNEREPIVRDDDILNTTDLQIEAAVKLEIYPNPTQDVVNLFTDLKGTQSVSVFNSLGQKITSFEFEGKHKLDVSKYLKGAYILKVQDAEGMIRVEDFGEGVRNELFSRLQFGHMPKKRCP